MAPTAGRSEPGGGVLIGGALRLVVIEGHYLVREGVRSLLHREVGIEVVATCGDLETALATIAEQHPDVVLTDIRMPPENGIEGIELADRLRVSHPEIGVVVLSQYPDPHYALRLLEGGADGRGYVLEDRLDHRGVLLSAIRAAAAGESFIDPLIVAEVLGAGEERSPLADLTRREREILTEIATGKSNAAVAESLVLTKRAVEKHINSIFYKLHLTESDAISPRVKAVLLWIESGES
ncbi:MAG TPA: response regulator transcription factor [Solirubrobacteraceae bacterium]|nr:response regulator transcription factor [Solirubrobacteraceae bacterium]